MTVELTIARMGADGDGVASNVDGSTVYVPWMLPGERVRVATALGRNSGMDASLLHPSPDRVEPPCPHFGLCGGCALQHWRADAYLSWKAGLVTAALVRAGFDAAVPAPTATPPRARRRMDLALRRHGGTVTVGLHGRRSAEVIDLLACHVLKPPLFALIAKLRAVLPGVAALRREGSAIVNLLDSGPDLLLRLDGPLTSADRQRLADWATASGVGRVSFAVGEGEPETAAQLRPAEIALGGVRVHPPPGAFLQASAQGEAAIVAAVLAGLPQSLPRRSWIAELFAGCGTLTFALAQIGRVRAFEGSAGSVDALRAAANAAQRAGRIEATRRDLTQRPLLAAELAGCAAVVLDPPHAGAAAQIPEIVRARIERVVYVSCNPATLGRDAAVLYASGYRLVAATAIDQFLWSARVESVSVFAR